MATGFSAFPNSALAPTLFSRCCRRNRPRSGELTEITIAELACQLLFASFFSEAASFSFRGTRNQQLMRYRLLSSAGNAVEEPGSISEDKLNSPFGFRRALCCPAAGVSHVECLESMAYKNRAVKPLVAQLSQDDFAGHPCAPRTPARRSPDPREFWPKYQRSCGC